MISSQVVRTDYVGNGVTQTFTFPFGITADSDLVVTVTDLDDVESIPDFTIDTAGYDEGGSITLSAGALATGFKLSIRRILPLTQETDIHNQGGSYLGVIESTFDRVVMMVQQVDSEVKEFAGNLDDLAADALDAALDNLNLGGTLQAPTDGKFGGTGSGITGTAGSVSGIDIGMSVADAMDLQEKIFEKLAPAKPANLSATPLSIAGSYPALEAGTGTARSIVIDSTTPTISHATGPSTGFYDGDAGTLTAKMDTVAVGTKALTTSDDTGTYGQLQIIDDIDYWAGVSGKSGFWRALHARIVSATLALGVHTADLVHSTTGTSSILFAVDDPGNTTVTFGTVVGSGTGRYISGVPSLAVGDTISVPITVANAVRSHYNGTTVATTSCPQTTSVNTAPPGTPPANGSNLTATPSLVVVTNAYAETPTISSRGFNSKSVGGTIATTTPSIRIDTKSTESRVSSGTGQYPSSGYGSAWAPTALLSANKELQMLGGAYQYPPLTNYSGNLPTAGPNYTGLTADSYASMRWVTFNMGTKTSVTSLIFTLTGTNLGTTALISSFAMYVRIDGGTPTTGWIDANAAYPGTGNPTANGDPALDVGSSSTATTTSTRRVTLGSSVKTGTVFVRIGIPSGSTKTISNITLA